MFDSLSGLVIDDVLRGVSSHRRHYRSRFRHGLIFKPDGLSRYTFANATYELGEGSVLFIPQGTDYEVRLLSEGESHYVAVNFSAEIDNPVPTHFSLAGRVDSNHLAASLADRWLFGRPADRYRCLALLYDLLAHLSEAEHRDYALAQKASRIAPAVSYLATHIFEPSLRVSELAALCGLSDTYFRHIFREEYAVLPREYIVTRRLTRARALLVSGDYTAVAEVAAAVGYPDPFFFSRIFRQRYGVPPSSLLPD